MARRAVVFDLDGTLVDTLADIAFAMNQALVDHGFPAHSATTYRAWLGGGAAELAREATPRGHASEPVLAAYRQRYAARLLVDSRAYDGIPALLDALSARGVPLAVLSNKPDGPTKAIVAALFPSCFALAFGQREGIPKKPDPTALRAIATELGVHPSDLTMVGDSGVDIETGRRAGARAVGVTWGYRPEAELVAAGAAHVVHSTEALGDFLVDGE